MLDPSGELCIYTYPSNRLSVYLSIHLSAWYSNLSLQEWEVGVCVHSFLVKGLRFGGVFGYGGFS